MHVQPVSGARKAELFGDGYEIAKLPNVERDWAAGDGFGNTGLTYSINPQRRVERAAPHIFVAPSGQPGDDSGPTVRLERSISCQCGGGLAHSTVRKFGSSEDPRPVLS